MARWLAGVPGAAPLLCAGALAALASCQSGEGALQGSRSLVGPQGDGAAWDDVRAKHQEIPERLRWISPGMAKSTWLAFKMGPMEVGHVALESGADGQVMRIAGMGGARLADRQHLLVQDAWTHEPVALLDPKVLDAETPEGVQAWEDAQQWNPGVRQVDQRAAG